MAIVITMSMADAFLNKIIDFYKTEFHISRNILLYYIRLEVIKVCVLSMPNTIKWVNNISPGSSSRRIIWIESRGNRKNYNIMI